MKKIIITIIAVSFIFTMGCSKKSESLNKEVTPLENFQNTEYNAGTDYQFFWNENADIVTVQDGYYINYMGFLYYMDKENAEVIPVCSNIDCNHKTEECDAYLGDATYIQYYDGYIYYVLSDSRTYFLYRKLLDGSSAEKVCKLFSGDIWPKICVHRGYAYYSIYTGGNDTSLYRVALEVGAEPEKLYNYSGYDADLQKIRGYGDGVLFIECCSLDKDYTEFSFNICYYDSNEDAVKSVLKNVRGDYAVVEDKIYYTMSDGVHCYDVSTGMDELFFELNEYVFLSYDGKSLYFDNRYNLNVMGERLYFDENDETDIDLNDYSKSNHKVYVLDLDGNMVDCIDAGYFNVLFGDEDYLFQGELNGFSVLNKNALGTGLHEWKSIEISVY